MTPPPGLFLDGTAAIGGSPVFGPVRFEVPPGQWTCLLGASGVGKSTVLRLFAELDDGIAFGGSFGASDHAPLRGRVALMAQEDLLLPWRDVLGNVTLGARLRGAAPDMAAARHILARVGLADHAQKKPNALSGGQRQRAALARTLLEDRPVVLLDEPFSALDARTRAQVQELSATLLRGRTVLHVTHDPAEAARLGHHILHMHSGGTEPLPAPATPTPRPFDAPATLELQAALHRRLMVAA